MDIRLQMLVERHWLRPPGWLATLPEADRALFVADFFLSTEVR